MTAPRPPSLWRHRDFMLLWSGQAVSEVGSQVTVLALPLLAALTLHATTFEIAALSAASSAAFLLVALQAGALVDRRRKKRVMVWADSTRALVIATVPAAKLAGVLTIWQLYVVALVSSVLTVFFDVAYQSYLPVLVSREQLVDGNAKIGGSQSFAQFAGPSIGGLLVAAVGAAYAVVVDAVSFVVSTGCTAAIDDPETRPRPHPAGTRLRTEIAEGLGFVLRHPILKRVVGCTATANFFSNMWAGLEIVFLVRVLHASPRVIGLVFALGALGGLVGAATANRLARVVGSARIIWVSMLAEVPFAFAGPSAFPGYGVLLISLSGFALGLTAVVYNVAQVSYRQAVTPAALLGRMNASTRFIVWGVMPLGSLAGGVLGSAVGIRTTLYVAALGQSLAVLWVIFSPLFGLRDVPGADPASA
ncbi:MAG: MFS transporter [Mycobacteriales bacterium]